MTREAFLDWAALQNGRHEFDGFQPLAMTGGGPGRWPGLLRRRSRAGLAIPAFHGMIHFGGR